jgi:hypothetical protein
MSSSPKRPTGLRGFLRITLRVLLGALGVVALCVLFLGAWLQWADRETHRRMRALEATWSSRLEEIPVGSDESVAKAWIKRWAPADQRNEADEGPDRFSHSYAVSLGSVDVVGPHFPCAAWILRADIGIGAGHRVTSRRTQWGGVCI